MQNKSTLLARLLLSSFLTIGCISSYANQTSTQNESERTFRIGVISLSDIEIVDALIGTALKKMQAAFAPRRIEVKIYPSKELERAISQGKLDAFIASSGFYWRMRQYGARDVASMIFAGRPDPNNTSAITYITRKDNTTVKTVEDMKGLRLSTSYPSAFMGYRIGLAELAAKGYDPDKFFSSVVFENSPTIENIAQKVLDGRADVAFIQSCWLEKQTPKIRAQFRVVAPIETPNYPCLHSTRTYPNITAAVLRTTPSDMASDMAKLLLNMPPDSNGNRWGLVTDFQAVDRVYQLLKIEHYAYLKEWSVKRWVNAHKHWLAAGAFCLLLLVLHSFIVSYLVKRRTEELALANREKIIVQQRLEALYNRMEKIRKASIVGQLSSMIAHELAQPLGAAQSFYEGLLLHIKNKTLSPEKLDRSLAGINRGLMRIRHIVERVRTYNRGEVDRDGRQNLAEIIKTAADSLSSSLRQEASIDIRLDKNFEILGDRLELELLFNNLLSNAVTAAARTKDRHVTVTGEATEDGGIVVYVENPGHTFTEEDIALLTVPFISEKGLDHGLGVPIAASLAEANGGHLRYRARVQGGLIAIVTLRKI